MNTSLESEQSFFKFVFLGSTSRWRCCVTARVVRSSDACKREVSRATPRKIHTKAVCFGRFRLQVFCVNDDESKRLRKNSGAIIQHPLLLYFCQSHTDPQEKADLWADSPLNAPPGGRGARPQVEEKLGPG